MERAVTRRGFLGRASAGAVAVLAPQALVSAAQAQGRRRALLRDGRFREGVMSGDPTPRAVTLWTRVDEVARQGAVRLEVARDRGFRRVVAEQLVGTSESLGGSVKARVTGLDPYEQYYYRFETRTTQSEVGRFRTAPPPGSGQPLTFAFYSCQDYTHGYYNAHEVMAREDLDFVVCLGDYIYAETYHTRRAGTAVRDDLIGSEGYPGVPRVATTLEDYRRKYALYRSDAALRRVQARAPTVVIWDDHEVQNNYAGDERDGGLPAAERFSQARRRAAYRAWFEAMPTYAAQSSRIYRRLRFGDTLDLLMLDQRQYRDDQPCGDAAGPPCPERDQPREFLGRRQMGWLKDQLVASRAAWKVIGNEVTIMPTRAPGNTFLEFDSWQGYPGEREELLGHVRDRAIRDVVFVTGDIHTFIAGDVRTNDGQGEPVALEFVGGSITSTNFGETNLPVGPGGQVIPGNDQNPNVDPNLVNALRQINPWVDNANLDRHGFGLVRASPREFDVTLKRVETIKRRTPATEPDQGFRWRVERGQRSIKGVNGPA